MTTQEADVADHIVEGIERIAEALLHAIAETLSTLIAIDPILLQLHTDRRAHAAIVESSVLIILIPKAAQGAQRSEQAMIPVVHRAVESR